jgi:hypothetical protein
MSVSPSPPLSILIIIILLIIVKNTGRSFWEYIIIDIFGNLFFLFSSEKKKTIKNKPPLASNITRRMAVNRTRKWRLPVARFFFFCRHHPTQSIIATLFLHTFTIKQ